MTEHIDIDPIEELLKAIGIVHGHEHETTMRTIVHKMMLLKPESRELQFMECVSCMAKPGAPYLCMGCLHNRKVIGDLKQALSDACSLVTTPLPEDRQRILELQRLAR